MIVLVCVSLLTFKVLVVELVDSWLLNLPLMVPSLSCGTLTKVKTVY